MQRDIYQVAIDQRLAKLIISSGESLLFTANTRETTVFKAEYCWVSIPWPV